LIACDLAATPMLCGQLSELGVDIIAVCPCNGNRNDEALSR